MNDDEKQYQDEKHYQATTPKATGPSLGRWQPGDPEMVGMRGDKPGVWHRETDATHAGRCAKCWSDAAPRSDGHYPRPEWESQVDGYHALLAERTGENECTPAQQLGGEPGEASCGGEPAEAWDAAASAEPPPMRHPSELAVLSIIVGVIGEDRHWVVGKVCGTFEEAEAVLDQHDAVARGAEIDDAQPAPAQATTAAPCVMTGDDGECVFCHGLTATDGCPTRRYMASAKIDAAPKLDLDAIRAEAEAAGRAAEREDIARLVETWASQRHDVGMRWESSELTRMANRIRRGETPETADAAARRVLGAGAKVVES